jgi:hypothetical protein
MITNMFVKYIKDLLYTYISVLNATYCLVAIFVTTCFGRIRPSSGVVYLAKIVTLYVKFIYGV